jgi:hypothetical protein
MNAAFFGLAGLAALNPKLLVLDLILVANRRPRPMFVCFLLGGLGLGVAVGLLDVLILHLDAIKPQNHASGGVDLALGIALLALVGLLASNRLRVQPVRQTHRYHESTLKTRVTQALREPRYGLAALVGVAVGVPGASYLLALHRLISSTVPTPVQVVAVFTFVTISFAPVIVPFGFFLSRPEGTERAVKRFQAWVNRHLRQIATVVALLAGGFMVITGVVRLLN